MKYFIFILTLIIISCDNDFVASHSNFIVKTETKYLVQDNSKSLIYIKEFDNSGKLIKVDNFLNHELYQSSSFEYIESKTIEIITNFNPNNTTLVYSKEYNYDASGNLSELVVFNSLGVLDFTETYKYDELGRLILKLINPKDSMSQEIKINYINNKNGQLEKVYSENSSSGLLIDSLIYSAQKIEKYTINNDGDFLNKSTFVYNNNGEIIEEITLNLLTKETKKYIYQYTYQSAP